MILDKHWWRTDDGRLVPDGHPDAAFLAYPRGQEIPDALADKFGLRAAVDAAGTDAKRARRPADKMAPLPADKAARPPSSGTDDAGDR